jgi:hypothetical protein
VRTRDKLRQGAAGVVRPGEEIQAVFPVRTGSRDYADRAVIATDRRLLLFSLNEGWLDERIAEVPRNTRIGPCHGLMFYRFQAFGRHLSVSRLFFPDVAEADRLITSQLNWGTGRAGKPLWLCSTHGRVEADLPECPVIERRILAGHEIALPCAEPLEPIRE